MTTEFDDFDDAAFANFDVDAAVANSAKKKNPKSAAPPETDEFGDDVMFDDFDVDAAVSKKQSENDSAVANSPFGPNFKGSIGTITYPSPKELNAAMMSDEDNKRIFTEEEPNDPSQQYPFKRQAKENKRVADTQQQKQQQPNQQQMTASIIPPSTVGDNISISKDEQKALELTLNKKFGYPSFRAGQLPIIHSLLHEKRDAAVFWSTGSGKSLCYQIPPLHSGKIALIISPLISLMEDQVAKLNGIVGDTEATKKKDIAVFLGSGQRDPMAEQKALNGDYQLIYCTPEKLVNGWFLDQIGNLHTSRDGGGLCLIAIDEAHCVSEWGHDFRKDYRTIGSVLRSHDILKRIPIVALTATAVPRVQTDILSNLQLRSPKIVKQSFDRDNLVISIKRKPAGGYRVALKPLVEEMKDHTAKKSRINLGHASTIIYCPTQSQVEEVTDWLQGQLKGSGIRAQSYHGGQGIDHRSDAHVNFLTSKTSIIVATLAFGMGIDKTDTRRIIHYGPPKTVEEYYQQIGRAGRDGLEAQCIMYCNSGDFDKYKTDFYLGGLSADARLNQEQSIESLRTYAMSDESCRRAELLKFFHETPSFGERCGTCDTCVARSLYSGDTERDFAVTGGARLVLYTISVLNGKQGTGVLEKVLRGNKIESYRYNNRSINEDTVTEKVQYMKSQMSGYKKRVPVTYFTKDLLPALVSRGFVKVQSQSTIINGRGTSWSAYQLSSTGRNVLESGPIVLPVPASIREYEKAQQEKIQKSLEDLKKVGANIDQIPKHELEEGDGTVFKALRTWYNYMDNLERNNRTSRIDDLEDLRLRIDAWRMDVAEKYRIAPADAMPDHLLLSVAYAAASLKNSEMEKEALLAVGVRSGGIDDLVAAINQWINEFKDLNEEAGDSISKSSCAMIIPDEAFEPKQAWEHFVYRKNKKTGLASWESSYDRFTNGEHPQTIAMSPLNGRPIQVNTVLSHIFDGALSGRPINLSCLATLSAPPTKSEWDTLSRMEAETGITVIGDPKTSGKNGESVRITDFLGPIMGEEFLSKEYSDRTPQEKSDFERWCNLFKWYSTLTRIGYVPTFESEGGANV